MNYSIIEKLFSLYEKKTNSQHGNHAHQFLLIPTPRKNPRMLVWKCQGHFQLVYFSQCPVSIAQPAPRQPGNDAPAALHPVFAHGSLKDKERVDRHEKNPL
jgi:hypothetical protein